MTWRTRNDRGRWLAPVAASWLVAIACLGCRQPPELLPGQGVEAELAPRSEALYRLALDRGDYVLLEVAPVSSPGREVSVEAVSPGGATVGRAVGIRFDDQGVLAWVSEAGGDHRVRVTNPDLVAPVAYRLVVGEIREAHPEDRYRAAAESARAEGLRLSGAGEAVDARAVLERAVGHWRRAGDVEGELEALLDLVGLERYSDPEAALTRAERVRRESERAGATELAVTALEWRGRILRQLGECDGALAAYREALDLAATAELMAQAANVQFNVGALQERCAPEHAAAAYRRAIELAERGGDRATAGVALSELSIIARNGGDLETARELVDQGWALVRGGDDYQAEADVAHELGNVDRDQGRLTEAYEHFLRCLELNEALGNRHLATSVLLSLGSLALDLRRPEEARAHLERAERIAGELDDARSTARAQLELGAVHSREGDLVAAEELFRRSLATAERISGADAGRRVAEARFRLGGALLDQGRIREAVIELRAALDRQVAVGSRRDQAYSRRTLGSALARLGDVAAGIEQLERALALHRDAGDPVATAWTLYRLAEVQAEIDPASSRATLEQAIDIGQRLRGGLMADRLRTGFAEGSRLLYDLYIELLIAAGEPAAAFRASEQGRARALLDLLSEARVDLAVDVAPELRERQMAVQALISRLQLQLRGDAGKDPAETAELRARLGEAEQDAWQVEAAIRESSLRYREIREPSIEGVEQLQARLPPGRALIEYWLGERGCYAFVVTRDTFSVLSLPPAEDVRGLVRELRAALLGRQPPERYAAVAHRAYRDLVAPALEAAGGPVDEVVVVPDGALHLIPFEALVTAPAGGRDGFEDLAYLLRRVTLSYAPSAAVLNSLRKDPRSSRPRDAGDRGPRLVAYADPRYDRPLAIDCPDPGRATSSPPAGTLRAENLTPLSGSRREVEAIAARLGRDARVHLGAEASEERFKRSRETAAAELVHVAVHGFVCPSYPERSGLVFALDGPAGEDGILQVREIFQLDLSAQLVVLSACDTGGGRLMSGEGVVGLSRAFFYAGASSLVVSLWQVSDRSTAPLMAALYEGLERGEDRAAALRRAQLALIEPGGRQAAPFYWAPFILLGARDGTASAEGE